MDPSVRISILRRDGGCVAPVLDWDAGPCYDQWGEPMPLFNPEDRGLEVDYVRLGARGPRHVLEQDHVTLCAGHHRGTGPNGGRMWGPGHRQVERDYLTTRYRNE